MYVPVLETAEILKGVSSMAKDQDILRQSLARPGSQYTDEQKREAAAQFVVLGNMRKVSDVTEIPARTINSWKLESDWWGPLCTRIRDDKADELDSRASAVIDRAFNVIEDRLANGETVYIGKDAIARQKPVTLRDAAWTGAVWFDKRQILRNQPTSIRAGDGTARLKQMAKNFEAIAREIQAKTVSDSANKNSFGEHEQKGGKK